MAANAFAFANAFSFANAFLNARERDCERDYERFLKFGKYLGSTCLPRMISLIWGIEFWYGVYK